MIKKGCKYWKKGLELAQEELTAFKAESRRLPKIPDRQMRGIIQAISRGE